MTVLYIVVRTIVKTSQSNELKVKFKICTLKAHKIINFIQVKANKKM